MLAILRFIHRSAFFVRLLASGDGVVMQRILIVGATSAIAEATARQYAMRGAALFLVARDAARLDSVCADLRVRGASTVHAFVMDVNHTERHGPMLAAGAHALGAIDVCLVAHGTLPDQSACEDSLELAMHEFQTNGSSTIALANAVAARLQAQGSGTLAVISSVAGDRGRASNYIYGSAKAAVTACLSGMRQRFRGTGVNVLTIKPGFVDTPMTQAFKKGLLWAAPSRVAAGIVRAIDRRRSVVYLPWFWHPIMLVIRNIPEFIFSRMKL
jgi:decaprenylphospho-beta-D-erythro-pentofuranosid-2-ulose 2-reductase